MGQGEDQRPPATYPEPSGTRNAKRYDGFRNLGMRFGLLPERWITLEVPGRKSRQDTQFPLAMVDLDGHWYLVSTPEEGGWVRHVRAAGGRVRLRRRHSRPVRLVEVPPQERAPILRQYLRTVPGVRAHFPVHKDAPIKDFHAIAIDYPVFRVMPTPDEILLCPPDVF